MARLRRAAALGAMAVALLLSPPADALKLRIDSITAQDPALYTPNARLGLEGAFIGETSVVRGINRLDCAGIRAATKAEVVVTWSWTDKASGASTPRYAIKLAPPGATCDSKSMTVDATAEPSCTLLVPERAFASADSAAGETFALDLDALLGATACGTPVETEARVVFVVSDTQGGVAVDGVSMSIAVDTQPPAAPEVAGVISGDGSARVSWQAGEGADKSIVYWSDTQFSGLNPGQGTQNSGPLSAMTYTIANLANEKTWYVAVTSVDALGNESAAAEVVEARPMPVQDFWAYYKTNGGAAEGGYPGCSAGSAGDAGSVPGGLLLALSALAIVALRRRSQPRPRQFRSSREPVRLRLYAPAPAHLCASPTVGTVARHGAGGRADRAQPRRCGGLRASGPLPAPPALPACGR